MTVQRRVSAGTTLQRPVHPVRGFIYFDSTLDKTIVWDGAAWVNLDGSAL